MITVLMSTYNGDKFIKTQLDSIISQKDVDVNILVRDDGSNDSTISILQEYEAAGQLKWYSGKNLGSARSFLDLLDKCKESDYYAFADQDDFWCEEKLSTAIRCISSEVNRPALYFAQPQPADSNLNPVGACNFKPNCTFGESLMYWFAMGCTMVMNKALRDIIVKHKPEFLYMHDVWIYSIACAVGAKIVWDDTPHTLNRQHGNNVVGLNGDFKTMMLIRLRRFFHSEQVRYRQALELSAGYKDVITPHNIQTLNNFISAKKSLSQRIRLIANTSVRCNSKTTMLLFWINVLFNRY